MVLRLSPLASTSLPSSAGGLKMFQSKKLFLSVLSENTDGITIQGTVSG